MKKEPNVLKWCLLVLVVTFIFPYLIRAIRGNAITRRPPVVQAVPRPAPPPPTPAATIAPILSPAALSGLWLGNAALEGRGFCILTLELRPKDANQIAGYFTLSCTYGAPFAKQTDPTHSVEGRMNPETAVLTGTPETGFYRFTVDRVLNPDVNGCGPSSFTATPFGNNRLATEWQEPTCKGGHVVLMKERQ